MLHDAPDVPRTQGACGTQGVERYWSHADPQPCETPPLLPVPQALPSGATHLYILPSNPDAPLPETERRRHDVTPEQEREQVKLAARRIGMEALTHEEQVTAHQRAFRDGMRVAYTQVEAGRITFEACDAPR